jgi:hypothetical protein
VHPRHVLVDLPKDRRAEVYCFCLAAKAERDAFHLLGKSKLCSRKNAYRRCGIFWRGKSSCTGVEDVVNGFLALVALAALVGILKRSAADTMHSWKIPRYDLAAPAIAPLQVLRFTTTYLKLVLAGQLGRFASSLRARTFQTCFPKSMSREMATNSVRRMPYAQL